ncbi:MAG: family 20 glycosylhydrolase [Candidatus Eremiobacteraeota bacterium]|nr:family 20 glycosylhydrolase [Candidatus Eremiobacteraeota bacterium]
MLVPEPRSVGAAGCAGEVVFHRPLRLPAAFDPGARALLDERWRGLGIPPTTVASDPDVRLKVGAGPAERYRLGIDRRGIALDAAGPEAAFDAAMTLAQLARPVPRGFSLPCVQIADEPALRWRIVSDDVSRGPLPTMRYFKERVRGLAGLKINGYSIYMEHAFADAAHPLVGAADAISPRELRELRDYAARFHVALIPEQQTFAHMHPTLRWETYAPLAELPHGWLLSPAVAGTYDYLTPLLREVVAAAGAVPFVHLGSDEPIDLGRGRSQAVVASEGLGRVFAGHVNRVEAIVKPLGVRPMIWDDAIQKDPSILALIPKSTVIVDFHYGVEKTYAGYIAPVASRGFEQMVSPGAQNWNQIFPELDVATTNIGRFVAEGRAAHVLGMFATVWHDDGESLYEATWYPLAFAAASAWQSSSVDAAAFERAFGWAFFGSDDRRWGRALAKLDAIGRRLHQGPDPDPSDYLFWSDPFDAKIGTRVRAGIDLAALRLDAESVLTDVAATPPLHPNAARVMALAARRFDALGRRVQIGAEAKDYYDDARAHAGGTADGIVYRGLNLAKYLCWELRDDLLAIEPLYRAAWNYESRPGGLGAVLTRFHLAEEDAQRDADRLNAAQREDYYRMKVLPPFEDVLRRR